MTSLWMPQSCSTDDELYFVMMLWWEYALCGEKCTGFGCLFSIPLRAGHSMTILALEGAVANDGNRGLSRFAVM